MTIIKDGISKRIGLTLSGGGFRAAAFHLGVFRKLASLGLLDKLDLISCVSGGSIAGAYLASNWHSPSALDELEQYLGSRSIAVGSVIGGLLDPFAGRIDKLAETYDHDLFHGLTLNDIPCDAPRLYLNATNLATGNMFFFVAGGGKKAEMGEHELGVIDAPSFSIARAVAASSAFPPVFPPLKLNQHDYPPAAVCDYVTLSDGGLYDNLGVNPGLSKHNELDFLIVSDGGKPFSIKSEPTESGLAVLKEGLDIMMEQIRGQQFDRLAHRHKAGVGPCPLWFSIDSTIGQAQDGDAAFASSISTNLCALSKDERAVLSRHGGALLARRIADYAPALH